MCLNLQYCLLNNSYLKFINFGVNFQHLLRSRAIECQTYVIAAAQTGRHNPKRTSYGHAMVI